MNSREDIQKVIELYIKAMNNDDVDRIPLTEDVEFRGAGDLAGATKTQPE